MKKNKKTLTLEEAAKMMENVGGWLDLRGTGITSLPDNLTVGGSLDLSGTGITDTRNVKRLENGDYCESRYIYADEILTHVARVKQIHGCTFYVGKIKGKNVLFDGEFYAHCATIREGMSDIAFKRAKDRGADQYREIGIDDRIPFEEAVTMYRIITGACAAGTQAFIDELRETKDEYTPREIIELTSGRYGADTFKKFFENREGE